jgi:hypothetical protein
MADTLPKWYTPEATQQADPNVPLPGWYEREPGQPAPAAKDDPYGVVKNIATAVAKVPGAIIGTPHVLAHAVNWGQAQVDNGLSAFIKAIGGTPLPNETGADLDKRGLNSHLPSPESVDNVVFGATGTTPYQPTSPGGKVGQAALTAGIAGLVDPAADLSAAKNAWGALKALLPNASKTAVAGGAAQGTQELFPNTPGLAALTAFLTHAGVGVTAPVAKAGFGNTVAPLLSPTARGRMGAGKVLTEVDNSQPGLATPSVAEVGAAKGDVGAATKDIGVGQDDYDAGGTLRDALQGRSDALNKTRSEAGDRAFNAFREEQPLEGAKLAPFMKAPEFRAAVKAASAGKLNRLEDPLTDFWDFNEAGDPILKPNAAVPPDVLHRIKTKIDDAIGGAKGKSDRADLLELQRHYTGLLDNEYAGTYPAARGEFAANSRPLDALETGPTEKVLDSEMRPGRVRSYSMPQDKVVRSYLQQNSTSRSSFDNLIGAFGGDKDHALSAIQENLVSKVQDAINPDGTLSQASFERAVRPYTKAIGMWFPELGKKFSTAQAAQKTFETVTEQKGLADSISNNALRGDGDFITPKSAAAWLNKNSDALERTQSPAAVMRLQQIVKALPDDPASGMQAAVEAAPMLVGGAVGGAEGGVLGGITHKIPAALAAPLLKRYYAEYNRSIEAAFTDPAYATSLAQKAAKFGGFKKVLQDAAKKAAMAAPIATNAGTGVSPR